ncbi:MAG: biotin synthase BioB [Victivallaceae bacterium]|nr:biotin synthase BioB [Victivallaceae bacterium]
MKLNSDIVNAYRVLDGQELTESEAMALTRIAGNDILDLVSLANKVRDKFAPKFIACSIINAKSGVCSQNCKFCAQSGCHHTGVESYPLLSPEAILESARRIYDLGVRSYGIVTSGFGYLEADDEFNRILAAMDLLRKELPELKLCLSLGILSETTARLLAEHGAWRYNMNLQTNPDRYAELISDTHSIVAKIQTIRHLQKHGVSICCGGIFGLGESWEDRVKMAFACRDLDADGIPLNVLLPIEGTPLEDRPVMDAADAAKAFAIFRLVNPTKMIKFAAGRETVMKDFQGLLMLAGMNSMITGGYLTTRGRGVEEDRNFLYQLTIFNENA